MKRCPQCKTTYADDTLNFCLEDGTPLAYAGSGDATAATRILSGGDQQASPAQLSRLQRPDDRRPIEHSPILDHVPDPARVPNVRQRIRVEDHHVGAHSDLNGSEFFVGSQNAGG